jgi:hypothetical protein
LAPLVLRRARDPHGTGLVPIVYPRESGMDNSPLRNDARRAVKPGPSVAHLREDTGFAAAGHRPTGPEYDRISISSSSSVTTTTAPIASLTFRLVADIGNAFLQRADQDLRFLLAVTGDVAGAAEVATMEQKTVAAIARCWEEEVGFYYSVDTRTSAMIRKPGIAGLLPLFADPAVAGQHPRLLQRLKSWLARVDYGVPSFEPARPEFEPQRYWRGPVWRIVNWMLIDGLQRSGAST